MLAEAMSAIAYTHTYTHTSLIQPVMDWCNHSLHWIHNSYIVRFVCAEMAAIMSCPVKWRKMRGMNWFRKGKDQDGRGGGERGCWQLTVLLPRWGPRDSGAWPPVPCVMKPFPLETCLWSFRNPSKTAKPLLNRFLVSASPKPCILKHLLIAFHT